MQPPDQLSAHRIVVEANLAGEAVEAPPEQRVLQQQRARRPLPLPGSAEDHGRPGRAEVGPLDDVGYGRVEVGQPRVQVELGAAGTARHPPLWRRRPRCDEVRDFNGVADGADMVAENGTWVWINFGSIMLGFQLCSLISRVRKNFECTVQEIDVCIFQGGLKKVIWNEELIPK